MNIANWISVLGTAIEIGGFGFLAYELRKTNTSAIIENADFQDQKHFATTIVVSDGDGGGISAKGGLIGKLIDNINARQRELTNSKALINSGLFWTGVGILVQLVGSIGQALG